jgi:RNA polymerase sigma-70 factor, ECF subfamily
MPSEFEDQLVALLPRMRVWALAMTRNRPSADDLVQDAAMKAWAAQDGFTMGTNFPGWIRRIMVNQFVSGARRRFALVSLDDSPETPVQAPHEDRIALRELRTEIDLLPPDQRDALFQVAVEETSYEELARATNCAIGTAKSRVHRARQYLRARMLGEPAAVPPLAGT